MRPKLKVFIEILPFGSISYKIEGKEFYKKEKKSEKSIYIEPITTNIENVDINYKESKTYIAPKTTV